MDQFKMTGHALELLLVLTVFNLDLEKCVIEAVSISVLEQRGGEFLVGRVERRGDIMREKKAVSHKMAKLDKVAVLNWLTCYLIRRVEGLCWNDLPDVVGVIEWVACNLLSLTRDSTIIVSQRIFIKMTVKVGLRLLMPHCDRVVVFYACRSCIHDIVGQGLLESRSHEVVAWARSRENREVDLEPEEVHDERHNDESNGTCCEMLAKVGKTQCSFWSINIEETPEIDGDSSPDSDEGEDTNVFGGYDTAHGNTSQEEPLPPLAAERFMPPLVESDVE